MKRLFLLLLPLLFVLGCDSGLEQQLADKDSQLTQVTIERDRLKGELKAAYEEVEKRGVALKQRSKAVEEQDKMIEELRASLRHTKATVESVGSRTRIRLPENLLFRSGEAALAASGIETLEQVGPVFAKHEGFYLEVAGFTDDAVIGPKLKKRFKNNLELSQERAAQVIKFLKENQGIKHKMAAIGFGPQFPAASNATKGGRQENRRVIITLVPISQRPM
ncbi:MAG: hypothetical protein A2508_02665 [Candidatus Lambdaproteobacteria bacterium RIFOXYD12_FULL_49_8]|nr:MAG: hypothetical protein A2508_02665 [Candidatus Lambdaproteobacteria bacterium RIFOXYD12_FULL_49_8]